MPWRPGRLTTTLVVRREAPAKASAQRVRTDAMSTLRPGPRQVHFATLCRDSKFTDERVDFFIAHPSGFRCVVEIELQLEWGRPGGIGRVR